MNACPEMCSKELKFCSGVHLNYTPEDTLESFVLEKRLTSKIKLNQADAADASNKCVKAAKLLKYHQNFQNTKQQDMCSLSSDKSSEQSKRPFLRKNQGRAAWCFRLRPLGGIATPAPASKLSLVPTFDESHNPTNSEPVKEICDCRSLEECSKQQTECNTFEGVANATLSCCDDKAYYETGLQNDAREGSLVNEGVRADSVGYDRELEEFEFLERFAERHTYLRDNNEFEISHLGKRSRKASGTMTSVRKSTSLPAMDDDYLLRNIRKVTSGDKSKEATHRCTHNCHGDNLDSQYLKSCDCESCQSPSQNPLKNVCPTIESSSLDSHNHVQWKDEKNVKTSTDTNPNLRQPPPGVCFNVPSECHGPKLGDGITLDVSSNLRDDVFDRPSPSAIQTWISRLEAEVNRFNSENTALVKLKMEREEALSALKKEKKEFEEYRAATMKEFETFRREEITKLKKERKVLCDYQKSLHSMPQKRDREEIERLKQQICEGKAEAAQREVRLQHQLGRQRMRIEELMAEKAELVECIKRLERARLVLRTAVVEGRANQALRTPNQFHKNSYNRLDFVPQVIGINSHLETPEELLSGEMQKARAVSTVPNSERSVNVSSQPPPSRSTCGFLAGEAIKESPKSPFTCVPPHSSAGTAAHSGQQRARTSSDASEFCKGEAANAYRLCRPLCALSDRKRGPVIREVHHSDGSLEKVYCDGLRKMACVNGTTKELCPDGVLSVLYPSNGDVKQAMEDGTIVHNCAPDGTAETTIPDGTEEIVDKEPVICKSVARQSMVVEASNLPDGMSVQLFSNGDKIISLPNGQRELHCAKFKRRIYPDGTVKTVFKDGRQETRYASGRIRIKDNEGNLLVDTRIAPVSQSAVADLAPLLVPPH
ncbi:Centromere protein J [Taenia solium]|eukprot:TsM_000266300 transcript=TsM_000266300 gene=TsM_000266300